MCFWREIRGGMCDFNGLAKMKCKKMSGPKIERKVVDQGVVWCMLCAETKEKHLIKKC